MSRYEPQKFGAATNRLRLGAQVVSNKTRRLGRASKLPPNKLTFAEKPTGADTRFQRGFKPFSRIKDDNEDFISSEVDSERMAFLAASSRNG